MRVLIVDDHRSDRVLLRLHLEELRDLVTAVEEADGAAEARRLTTTGAFDVVIADHALGDGDGISVTRDLIAVDPDALVVLVSGHVDEALTSRAEEAGAVAVLDKDDCSPT